MKNWPADKVERRSISDLIPYARNSRTHSQDQIKQIAASMKEWGWTNPVLIDEENGIIAGHGRVMAAELLGYEDIPCMVAEGWSEAQKRAYVIADNKLALNADWNFELLNLELDQLEEDGFDISLTGFDDLDFDKIDQDFEENPYTTKVDTPNYEPTGEKPEVTDLYDDKKAFDLIEDIKNSNLSDKDKQFLMLAAGRHIVFNYEKIAEYYCHASKELQEFMEANALVVIDFDKAIENSYVKLSKAIDDQYFKEYSDEE
ncbi:MAG TPA: ParB/Srx family N-terminal domain-containing protein [Psychromonas sp.]